MFRKCNFVKRLPGAANASTDIAAVAENSTRVSNVVYVFFDIKSFYDRVMKYYHSSRKH